MIYTPAQGLSPRACTHSTRVLQGTHSKDNAYNWDRHQGWLLFSHRAIQRERARLPGRSVRDVLHPDRRITRSPAVNSLFSQNVLTLALIVMVVQSSTRLHEAWGEWSVSVRRHEA